MTPAHFQLKFLQDLQALLGPSYSLNKFSLSSNKKMTAPWKQLTRAVSSEALKASSVDLMAHPDPSHEEISVVDFTLPVFCTIDIFGVCLPSLFTSSCCSTDKVVKGCSKRKSTEFNSAAILHSEIIISVSRAVRI